jgi:LDH2 family malate/lactate/ureidoglycolate dehydrogenase
MTTATDLSADRFDPEAVIVDVQAIFASAGVPTDDAQLVAHSLVTSEMWGHPSHGLLRVRWYLDRIGSGVTRAGVEPELVVDGGALAVMDGRDGIGQVVTDRTMREAVRRARDHGVGVVSVRDSNHFGTAAYYTRAAAKEGVIALLVTNSSPAMAPWGGREKVFGANPWSLAAPAGRYGEVVMDISNTAVARGKIYAAGEQGVEIPDGWAMDADGRPTTDPVEAAAGLLMPMGGHKGYAVSFMMDVLAGVLPAAASGRDVRGPQQAEDRSRCGHFAMAIDIAAVTDPAGFAQRMEGLVEQAHDTPLADGVERIYVPGELEAIAEERARRDGIAVPGKTLAQLRTIAAERQVALATLGA